MAEDYVTARMVTLTDGVMSIAMTLLVLDIRLPVSSPEGLTEAELWQALVGIWPHLVSYGLSFLVIALLWISHAQKFRHVERMTGIMIWLNVLFLLGVGVVPFTTGLLAENGGTVATAVYASGMAFASLMLALMSVHARAAGLVAPAAASSAIAGVWVPLGTTAVFALSAGLAFINPDGAKYLWLLLIPLNMLRGARLRTGGGRAG